MSAVAGNAGTSIGTLVLRRLAAIDPLLPGPALPAGCGTDLVAAGPGGPRPWAAASTGSGEPGSLDLTWGAARRFQLTPQLAGPDVAGGLDQLLAGGGSTWRARPAGRGGHRGRDQLADPGHRRGQAAAAARARSAGRHRGAGAAARPGRPGGPGRAADQAGRAGGPGRP